MKFRYTKSVPKNNDNATAEILKAAANPKVISFGGGLPAPELFPVEEMKTAADKVFDKYGKVVLQYSEAIGYSKLRKQIIDLMKERKVEVKLDNVGIVTGSQQAIDLIARMLLNPGDVVITEDPTYLAAIDVFNSYGANIVGVSMDDDGMKTDDLEKLVKKYPEAKFIYTIPNFQNPTGRTMTEYRRKKLVKIAKDAEIPVVEDDPYGAIRYAGNYVPPLKHFDRDGGVIYLSSFSKILAPGLRMGWIVADKSFMNKFVMLKQNADLHTDNLTQYIVSQFLIDVDIKKHIKDITHVYEHRANLMVKQIDKYFPQNVNHSNPEGGMFIWVEVPGVGDTNELFKACIRNNVAFVPGSSFFAGDIKPGTFRLNFSNMNDDQIKEGIKRMGKSIAEILSDNKY
ncbi:aminotransferase-like domain-containing protein [Fructilactobacillus fructivorans]|uniref:Aspartate aminotransferase (AspB-4) n=1 Tax=Fructilactobacillus fructivorans TaxID=1614 RepID=A0A0C1PNN6_9LACO|nr:PLP-dependent aminotransferase family protein [Fructilactobacillus fructivorans]KID42352.1 Aspartate aminotransferase (AspB-4) [Fructilactobacillus fructivorans]MCT0151031.1 PLP-dependent aminotransferase family protein [Fructilactobacillus fructivorans]MCT2867411.1 PLP-dependent aminotransferase family protein [Fructilactobacillus fructivorans]MCT2869070.1 PLP-dependent aminotransferase family protein [Fructilactobacillus fructivorans]MCT2873210.1 PLP-dependent aminotransferase family prot